MPIAFFKLIWPKFLAFGAREWIGYRVPQGRITGGSIKIDIPAEVLASLPAGGHLPAEAVDLRLDLEDLEVHYIKDMPPLLAEKSTANVAGQRFFFNVPKSAIALPSGARVDFTDGEFIVGDLRPHIPAAEIHFKTEAKADSVLELLDQPSLGYISALGTKIPPMSRQCAQHLQPEYAAAGRAQIQGHEIERPGATGRYKRQQFAGRGQRSGRQSRFRRV